MSFINTIKIARVQRTSPINSQKERYRIRVIGKLFSFCERWIVRVQRNKDHSLMVQFYTTEKNQGILGQNLRHMTLFIKLSLVIGSICITRLVIRVWQLYTCFTVVTFCKKIFSMLACSSFKAKYTFLSSSLIYCYL